MWTHLKHDVATQYMQRPNSAINIKSIDIFITPNLIPETETTMESFAQFIN